MRWPNAGNIWIDQMLEIYGMAVPILNKKRAAEGRPLRIIYYFCHSIYFQHLVNPYISSVWPSHAHAHGHAHMKIIRIANVST